MQSCIFISWCVLLSYSITFSTIPPSLLNLTCLPYNLTHTSLHSVRGGVCTWGLLLFVFPPAWTLQGPAPPPPQQPRSSPPHPAPATTSLCPPPPTPVPQTSMHIAPGKWQPEPKLFGWEFDFKSQGRAKSYWLFFFSQKLWNVVLRFRIHEIRRQSTKYFPGPQFFFNPAYFSLTRCPSQ